MVARLDRDALASELGSLDALIASLDDDDFVSRQSLVYRRKQVAAELQKNKERLYTAGRVLLSFEGGPVTGSRGIDAGFAADALQAYQDLIAKEMASGQGLGLAQSGPVPAKEASRLNITSVVHGSFGFQLEEQQTSQGSMVPSAVKQSIEKVDELLVAFSSPEHSLYAAALETVDRRVFISLKAFYEALFQDSAGLKIIEDERDFMITQNGVNIARQRIAGVEVEDEQFQMIGELLGLTPIQRRFDFVEQETGRAISGQVGQQLSNDYLERLHGEDRISGRVYVAVMSKRTATRADGSRSESFTLLDLLAPGDRLPFLGSMPADR